MDMEGIIRVLNLKENAAKVFDTYLVNGFSPAGFFKEFVDYRTGYEETVFSIRRQSEGIYAIFHYLDFEKRNGRKHPEWEAKYVKCLMYSCSCKIRKEFSP